MDLSFLMQESDTLYLRNVSEEWKGIEDARSIQETERAWVRVSQATTGDNISRGQYTKRREKRLIGDGTGNVAAIGYVTDINSHELASFEVWATLLDAGNLVFKGKPLFAALPARKMQFSEFKTAWDSLPPQVTRAIHAAVLSVNRDWMDLGE